MRELILKLVSAINYPRRGFPRYGVDDFMRRIAPQIQPGDILLDAGAGNQPYRKLFSQANYESCDYQVVLEESNQATDIPQTFHCDLENIPKPDNTYDAIICNQVLEHVKRPQKVVSEMFRVLRPGGKLFLTTPQCSGLHMPPHNYFNFLEFGLRFLFEQAGFEIVSIKPLGGIFWVQGKVLQKCHEAFMSRVPSSFKWLVFPLDLLLRILLAIISFFLFYLDGLDRKKAWTLGYGCYCVKPKLKETL
ncbi:MAG: class I SAM-dependent methyltransferase [Candidatus Saganbacteria bacterium]|nr:class I SAM-dependent methyltransferase [Candidatus Saganbacteria bacterium]